MNRAHALVAVDCNDRTGLRYLGVLEDVGEVALRVGEVCLKLRCSKREVGGHLLIYAAAFCVFGNGIARANYSLAVQCGWCPRRTNARQEVADTEIVVVQRMVILLDLKSAGY